MLYRYRIYFQDNNDKIASASIATLTLSETTLFAFRNIVAQLSDARVIGASITRAIEWASGRGYGDMAMALASVRVPYGEEWQHLIWKLVVSPYILGDFGVWTRPNIPNWAIELVGQHVQATGAVGLNFVVDAFGVDLFPWTL